jgi:hypothetical protein
MEPGSTQIVSPRADRKCRQQGVASALWSILLIHATPNGTSRTAPSSSGADLSALYSRGNCFESILRSFVLFLSPLPRKLSKWYIKLNLPAYSRNFSNSLLTPIIRRSKTSTASLNKLHRPDIRLNRVRFSNIPLRHRHSRGFPYFTQSLHAPDAVDFSQATIASFETVSNLSISQSINHSTLLTASSNKDKNYKVKEDEVGTICSTHGGEEECI